MDPVVTAAVGDIQLSVQDGEAFRLVADFHGLGLIGFLVDAVHFSGNHVLSAINGCTIGGHIDILPVGDDEAGAFHVHDMLELGARETQDGHLVGGVEGHPQFSVHGGHVVAGVAEALDDVGIRLRENVRAVFLVLEVQQIEGGCAREGSLVENVQLVEAAALFTYFDIDTRELRVGGVFLGAGRYRDEHRAENQQCNFFHLLKNV